mgnify:CR=1 FL=1
MTEEFKKQIETQARQAVTELLAEAKLKKGDVFVVGCSSSEIVGGHIGKDSSLEAAQAVYAGIAPVLAENGIWLAAQCCEHLNRAIIIEREAAEKYGWEEVCVVPRPHAGGSWATTCWKKFREPVAVEEIRAHAGIDIGGTLIGMHLRRVAVPVRLSLSKIGEATSCAPAPARSSLAASAPSIPRRTEHHGRKESGTDAGAVAEIRERWQPQPVKQAATRQRCSCAPPARPARRRPWLQAQPCPLMCSVRTMYRSCAQT